MPLRVSGLSFLWSCRWLWPHLPTCFISSCFQLTVSDRASVCWSLTIAAFRAHVFSLFWSLSSYQKGPLCSPMAICGIFGFSSCKLFHIPSTNKLWRPGTTGSGLSQQRPTSWDQPPLVVTSHIIGTKYPTSFYSTEKDCFGSFFFHGTSVLQSGAWNLAYTPHWDNIVFRLSSVQFLSLCWRLSKSVLA